METPGSSHPQTTPLPQELPVTSVNRPESRGVQELTSESRSRRSQEPAGQPEGLTHDPQSEPGKSFPEIGLRKKIMIILTVNIVLLGSLVSLLGLISQKARQVQFLNSQIAATVSESEWETVIQELAISQREIKELAALFPDEVELIAFVKIIDQGKGSGLVTHFSFASDEPVKDKTGFVGIPLVIELSGTWSQVNQTLDEIQNLPFIVRAITVEITAVSESEFKARLGGILYVNEAFN